MFRLSQEIQQAIRATVRRLGTNRALAESAGCHPSLIGKLTKPDPERSAIHYKVLKGLYPHLKGELSSSTQSEIENYLVLDRRLAASMAEGEEVIPPGVSREIDRLQAEIAELRKERDIELRESASEYNASLSAEARLVAENFDRLSDETKGLVLAEIVKLRYDQNQD